MKEYALNDVMRLTGLKRSQVEYLVRAGVIAPSIKASGGAGDHRKFNFVDVFEFAVAGALMAVGSDVPTIRGHFNSRLRVDNVRGFPAFMAFPGSDYLAVVSRPHEGDPNGGVDSESCEITSEGGVIGFMRLGFWCRVVNMRALLTRLESITGERLEEVLRLRYEQATGDAAPKGNG